MEKKNCIVLRFNNYYVDTLKEHREIYEKEGEVIWGLLKKSVDSPSMRKSRIDDFNELIRNKKIVTVLLVKKSKVKAICKLKRIIDPEDFENYSNLVPSYYSNIQNRVIRTGFIVTNYKEVSNFDYSKIYGINLDSGPNPIYWLLDDDDIEEDFKNIEDDKDIQEINNYYKDNEYNEENILSEIFLSDEEINSILKVLDYKKNIVLQGAPGVGKTFIAKRLAYLKEKELCSDRIEMVQFHQSYSYEDFVEGIKPDENGKFKIQKGIFSKLCQRAIANPKKNYYIIIDEINRGNLSKIFGELLMLIENSKRGIKNSIALTYSDSFYIPENLFLIATMNTADRSLAVVDYALRRRFSFITLNPAFNSSKFLNYLENQDIEKSNVDFLCKKMNILNNHIKKDLGKEYQIGHSYFSRGNNLDFAEWYNFVINLEIIPLVEEYWYDNDDIVEGIKSELLEGLN